MMKRVVEIRRRPGNDEKAAKTIRKGSVFPHRPPKTNLDIRYPWQHLVFAAFIERESAKALGKINISERAISARLRSPDPISLDEHIALRQALWALRRWLTIKRQQRQELQLEVRKISGGSSVVLEVPWSRR